MKIKNETEQYVDAVIKKAIGRGFAQRKFANFEHEPEYAMEELYQGAQLNFRKIISRKNKVSSHVKFIDNIFGTKNERDKEFCQALNYVKQAIENCVLKAGYSLSGIKNGSYRDTGLKDENGKKIFKKAEIVKREKELGRELTKEEVNDTLYGSKVFYGLDNVEEEYYQEDIGKKIDLEKFYIDFGKYLTLFLSTEDEKVREQLESNMYDVNNRSKMTNFYKRFINFLTNVDRGYTGLEGDIIKDVWADVCKSAQTIGSKSRVGNSPFFDSNIFKEFVSIVKE